MKIITLMENTTEYANLKAEHGLSLYIETTEHKILFDTGQTDAFYHNACELGICLEDVDLAILSHGHFDHGGGVHKFLEVNQKAPIYINEHAFGAYYSGKERKIGIDAQLEKNPRVCITRDRMQIAEGLMLYTCNDREKKQAIDSCNLYKKVDEEFILDDFLHEQYLLIQEGEKRVLISGCSHKGILNITQWFQPDVVIGGFHFNTYSISGEGVEILKDATEQLMQYPTKYYTCHCTGVPQYEYMKERMKEQLEYFSAGQGIVI